MTPPHIADFMLNLAGYCGPPIITQVVMEPSFGEGIFLQKIIKRLISECQKQCIPPHQISSIIKQNIFGIEKSPSLYNKAKTSLKEIIESNNIPIPDLSKNLICGDALLQTQFFNKIDLIIGNPPYIRTHNMSPEYRNIISSFTFSTGTTDLYILFYELGLQMLKTRGKLVYITPSSFMKNTSQKSFRKFLINSRYPEAIYDFKTEKVFPDADTYTCIFSINKAPHDSFCYCQSKATKIEPTSMMKINFGKTGLYDEGQAWNFGKEEDMDFLRFDSKKFSVKDIANVQNGIATNLDRVYIGKAYADKNKTTPYKGKHTDKKQIIWFNDSEIESAIIRRCVKESKFRGKTENNYILFPYDSNGKPIQEKEMEKTYPLAYAYLASHRHELEKRDMEKNTTWYLFARSQGILNMNQEKVIFPHIFPVTLSAMPVYILEPDIVVYSGMYATKKRKKEELATQSREELEITDRNGEKTKDFNRIDFEQFKVESGANTFITDIAKIFSDKSFLRYCILTGKPMAGGYASVSTKTVKEYQF